MFSIDRRETWRRVRAGNIVAALTLVAGLTASLLVLWTPRPQSSAEGADRFSAVYAAEYIEVISRKPHSVFDPEAHEEARLYLRDKLGKLVGAQRVRELDYSAGEVSKTLGKAVPYGIRNLLATIPGRSRTGVMVVAHYDSRGHIGRIGELGRSYGAADDGYGVATILEIARLFGQREDLANSIYLLLTDAEETLLGGARMMAKESGVLDPVGFVVNLEARGIKGPVYMFETGERNDKSIALYRRARYPVAYSLATAVYRAMPNDTDFSVFRALGKNGLNFAVLDDLYYYHTPRDNYDNIDLGSLQHYGAQVLPLVSELVSDPRYGDPHALDGTQDRVFFTLLPNLFIDYTEMRAHLIHLATLALFVALLIGYRRRERIDVRGLAKASGATLVGVALIGVLGYWTAQAIAFLGRMPFDLAYVRIQGTGLPVLAFLVGTVALYAFLYARFVRREADRIAFAAAGIGLNLLLAIASGFLLSGASFLFFVPALVGLIGLAGSTFVRNAAVGHLTVGVSTVASLLLVVPILYSLFLALTVGGLAVLAVVLAINLAASLPVGIRQWHAGSAGEVEAA